MALNVLQRLPLEAIPNKNFNMYIYIYKQYIYIYIYIEILQVKLQEIHAVSDIGRQMHSLSIDVGYQPHLASTPAIHK